MHRLIATKRKTLSFVGAVSACLCLAPLASAKEAALDAAPLEGVKLRLDGLLKEWPPLVPLSQAVSGSANGDPSATGLIGYDAEHLYVGMRVTDGTLVRTAGMGKGEDHATLKLSFPLRGGGRRGYAIELYPGVPGKSAGAVKLAGRVLVGASIIEAPSAEGLSFEAKIPWSSFTEARYVRTGLRAGLVYCDADTAGRVQACIGTSKKADGNLPALTTEAEYSLNRGLIYEQSLNPEPTYELFGNVVGDEMLERVAVYERFLTVTGWNYRGGKEFFYQDLQLKRNADLRGLELADFDGDGHDEVLVQRRVGTSEASRDYAEVWRFSADSAPPQAIFQHEVGITEGGAQIQNQVSVSRSKGKASLVVAQGQIDDVDPERWSAPTASNWPTLMPWEPIKSRRYEWRGGNFEQVEEKPGTAKLKPPKRGTRLFSGTGPPKGASDTPALAPQDPVAGHEAPPPPRAPSAQEMLDQVYSLYRSERAARKAKPRFDFVTNVAGDSNTERVLLHGSDLVVFGSHFKQGQSYVYTTVGVKDAADILDVTALDLSGDGLADIVVRAVLKAQASKRMGGKVVTRHALFVYRVSEHGISRIFAAETGRSLEEDTVLGHVRFLPSGHGVDIELRPGRAIGWTEQSYPFPEDKTPYGGLEPLTLPWSDSPARRYSYQGSEYKLR